MFQNGQIPNRLVSFSYMSIVSSFIFENKPLEMCGKKHSVADVLSWWHLPEIWKFILYEVVRLKKLGSQNSKHPTEIGLFYVDNTLKDWKGSEYLNKL